MRILRNASADDGRGAPPTLPVEPPAVPPALPPPAAVVVVNGDKTERELELEGQLQTERDARKKVDLDCAQLLDENQRLKTPVPVPVKKKLDKVRAFGIRLD